MKHMPVASKRRVLVAGAGSALLHALRSCGPHTEFTVLTTRALDGMPRQTRWVVVAPGNALVASLPSADHAVVQLGALRRAREAVFWRTSRDELIPLAAALRERGVRTLELLLADGSGLSPIERKRLHALAFEQVTERLPWVVSRGAAGCWPERLAEWMIDTVFGTIQQVTASLHQSETQLNSTTAQCRPDGSTHY
jgi:hypothetical protein